MGLVCGASACTGMTGGGGVSATGGETTAVTPRPTFPESSKQVILRFAKENGTAPAGDRFTEYDGAFGPELIWVAEKTGDLCVGSESVTAGTCQTAKRTAEARVPGVGIFVDSGSVDHGKPSWAVRLMASGETIDHLSCQGREFPVRKVFSVDLEGALRTVYTVVIPQDLQGEYRVAVRRDGQSAEERLDLNLEKVDPPVEC
ncbi:hypothetical protein ACH4E7_29815 [Kitasatospora sp. NPDC018058]|uniref:hypothetical protein n=1 Tax=Kitasatospora sp. NPDC018058 TaxID=3364025 RepID=UPI0037BFAECF